jgi:hypothetical protein
MQITNVASPAPLQERRRFGRLHVAQPGIYHINLPQSHELWTDPCVLLNISLGGIYITCRRQPPIEKNDIFDLTFDLIYPDHQTCQLTLNALVVRTEPRHLSHHSFGLALKLLSEPLLYCPDEAPNPGILFLDKLRILYQYYHLNQKAHEIISQTPEIRLAKTRKIKEYLDQGSYKIPSDEITQRLFQDLFLERVLRHQK